MDPARSTDKLLARLSCTYTLNARACVAADIAVVGSFSVFFHIFANCSKSDIWIFMEPSFVDSINLVLLCGQL